MAERKLLIISNDALVKEDMDYLFTKPLFKNLKKEGVWVKTLKTVYPSITYCCHTSMITGCYPAKTHLYNNEPDEWGNAIWTWDRMWNKAKTLIDAAKEKGLTTANVFWPVLGNDKNVDYNIPEYWSQTEDESLCDALRSMGTSEKVIKEIVEPNLYYIEGHQRKHPYADEFVFACTRDILVKYQPDVMVVHPAGVDDARHKHGVFNEYVTEELDYTYYWIEKIIRALKENGLYEKTDIILTSDHGQMNIVRWCHPNVLFVKEGFITLDKDNNVTDMKAYVKPVGGSAQVFVTDKSVYDKVYKFLTEAAESKLYGFQQVFKKEEVKKYGLEGDFDFVLESDYNTAFGWEPYGEYYVEPDLSDYRMSAGTHGYLPDKGPQPSMFMIGPDFNKGVEIERRDTIDMAVTVAKVFGLDLTDADGKVIEEAIKK